MNKSYFKYWGKAKRNAEDDGEAYHLLAYHSLDVAAVGRFVDSDASQYKKYWHGEYSYYWLFEDFASELTGSLQDGLKRKVLKFGNAGNLGYKLLQVIMV